MPTNVDHLFGLLTPVHNKGLRAANAVLVGALIFCVALLAFTIRGHERFFTTMDSIGLFYGVPLLGIIVLAALLCSSPIIRINGAATVTFWIIILYGFETYYNAMPVLPKLLPPGSDQRTKVDVINDLRARGQDAYSAVYPAYMLSTRMDGTLHSPVSIAGEEVLPLGGIPNVTSVLCNESGQWVTYEADSLGFNNPPDAWQAASVSIFAIGDSMVQGYCVPPAETFVGQMRNKAKSVLNLGTSGSGPLIELAALREFGPHYRPQVVLWFFIPNNDLQNLSVEKRSPLLMRYLNEDFRQNLLERREQIGTKVRAHIDRLYADRNVVDTDAGPLQRMVSFVGLSKLRVRIFGKKAHGLPDYPLLERILAKARKTTEAWNGQLYFVYLPSWSGATRGEVTKYGQEIREILFPMLRKLQIPLFDLMETFSKHPDPMSLFALRKPNHYSVSGHHLVSQAVLEKLAEQAIKQRGLK